MDPVESKPKDHRVRLLSAVNRLPPLPAVLSRLLGLLNSEMASSGQIASIIERDSVLSGSVLRCVNSAYYALPNRVSSIRHAVTLLGFKTVRNLALAFSMRRMITQSQPTRKHYAAYSRHALGTAIMTQYLSAATRSEEVDAAFAAGLLHDVGKLLILTVTPAALPEIIRLWEEDPDRTWEESELEVLDVAHSELSAIVLDGWKLPDSIRNAARYHHSPQEAPSGDTADSGAPSLAFLVHAADLAVNFEGFRMIESDRKPAPSPALAFEKLGLTADLPQALDRFQSEFDELQGVFT